jgi:hypothetical protein
MFPLFSPPFHHWYITSKESLSQKERRRKKAIFCCLRLKTRSGQVTTKDPTPELTRAVRNNLIRFFQLPRNLFKF